MVLLGYLNKIPNITKKMINKGIYGRDDFLPCKGKPYRFVLSRSFAYTSCYFYIRINMFKNLPPDLVMSVSERISRSSDSSLELEASGLNLELMTSTLAK